MLDQPQRSAFPTYDELRAMWSSLELTEDSSPRPKLDLVIEQVRKTHANGGAVRASFEVGPNPTFDFLIATRNFKFLEFPERLFMLESVRGATPALVPLHHRPAPDSFEEIDAFSLDGEVARWLYSGGAYTPIGSAEEAVKARRLAADACTELFGDRFLEIAAFRSSGAWCDFFFDVAWDTTWILLDKRNRILHLICATDTD